MTGTFTGFSANTFAFYDELELDNSKDFWAANKHRYESAVAQPMRALLGDLEPSFGSAKMFRPYRDVRFSADKSPYKDHQGAYIEVGPACGYYVQVSSGGLMVGAGWYAATSEQLARYRAAIDGGVHVAQLRSALEAQQEAGLQIGGDVVKTRPRGVPADHPDLDLMRHKTLLASASFAHDEPWLSSEQVATRVADLWRTTGPLVGWLVEHVTGSGEDPV